MADFTSQELKGKKINIVLSDGLAWKGQIFHVETGEPIDNVRGIDIHIDLAERMTKITATIKLVEDTKQYHNPVLVDVPVQTIEAVAEVD